MAVLQQKRQPRRIGKPRRKQIPVVIVKPGQGGIWNTEHPAPRSTIDYKNTKLLVKFISPQGKILPRRATGLTSKHTYHDVIYVGGHPRVGIIHTHNTFVVYLLIKIIVSQLVASTQHTQSLNRRS